MALIKGVQGYRYDFAAKPLNEEILNLEGYLSEEDAKIYLYKFLRNNVTFAAELLLGVKLFPFQALMIKGMMIGDFSMFVLSRGGSKSFIAGVFVLLDLILNQGSKIGVLSSGFRQCLKSDSLVFTDNGLTKLENVSIGDWIQAREGRQKVVDKWSNPKSDSLIIKTKRGFEFEAKIGHRLLAYNKDSVENVYKKIEDLQIGEILPIQTNQLFFGDKNPFDGFLYEKEHHCKKPINLEKDDLEFYYFLGMLIAEGSVYKTQQNASLSLVSGDIECLIRIQKYLKSIAPENSIPVKERKGREGTFYLEFSSSEFVSLLSHIGYDIYNWASFTKEIPYKILGANKEKLAALLQGMFDGDGGIHLYKKTPNSAEIKYTTSSKVLADQIRMILLNFGIVSKLLYNKAKKRTTKDGAVLNAREHWNVKITGKDNIRAFHECIGFSIPRKKDQLDSLVLAWDGVEKNNNTTSYVYGFGDFLKGKISKQTARHHGFCSGNLRKNIGYSTIERICEDKSISKDVLDKCEYLLKDKFYYDEIVSITPSKCETIDIEVENEHCYFGNGFVHHNSKFILLKCQDILNKKGAAIANSCGFKFTRGTDQWTLTCGKSEAIALPLADGSKIRGFRFKKLLLDEFLNIPKNIFQEVILPFLGVVDNPTERTELSAIEDKLIAEGKMTKEEKFIWPSNKLIILSSPSFKFEYMYQVYCQYRDLIMGIHKEGDDELTEKDAYRIIFQMGYDCLPVELYDANLLKQAKATMSEMAFTKEFGGQFVDESDGYFRLSKMVACTVEEGSEPSVEVAGCPQDKYLVSFDPSWAENSDSDDFAIEIFKLHDQTKTGTLVHAYGLSGASLNSHIEYMAYILLNFNVVGMCGDYMGGLQFVNACNESESFKERGLKIGLINGDFDDPTKYEDDLKIMKQEYRPTQRNFCYLRQPSSNWIREANELLQANIDHKRIHFAAGAHDANFEMQKKKKIPIAKLKWDNKFEKPTNEEAAMVDFIDFQKSMVELTKTQCANIEVITNPQGSQTFRLPLYMTKQKGPDRPRKDNYSALVLGNWFIKVYYDMLEVQSERVFDSFTPTVIK